MNIAVFIKQVQYVYAVTGRDPDQRFVGPWDVVELNNPLDEVALEQAVKIRTHLRSGTIWTLSLGGKTAGKRSAPGRWRRERTSLSGIDDDSWGDLDAWAAAVVLGRAVKKIGATIVLCGSSSLDLERGEVGQYVADQLGYPYVSGIAAMNMDGGGETVLLERSLGKGDREELQCSLPLVVGVDHGLCEPGYPSHVKMLEARKKELLRWNAQDLGISPKDLSGTMRLKGVSSPKPRPKSIPLLDAKLPAQDRINWLLSGATTGKEGTILEGTPQKLAQNLIDFLHEKKIKPV